MRSLSCRAGSRTVAISAAIRMMFSKTGAAAAAMKGRKVLGLVGDLAPVEAAFSLKAIVEGQGGHLRAENRAELEAKLDGYLKFLVSMQRAKAETNRELRTVEQEVNRLKERVFRSKATLQLLKELGCEVERSGDDLHIEVTDTAPGQLMV